MKPDDHSLTPSDIRAIRREADRLLREGGGYGRFPTPIDDLISAARLEVEQEMSLDPGFLNKLYRTAKTTAVAVRRALQKVLGLFDSKAGTIYLDPAVHRAKKPFLKLHETGHGWLPWQRDTYRFLEDCNGTLDPDIAQRFEREANVFASEVLFQLDAFTKEAADLSFGLNVPLRLSKKYGSSVYAAVRRYVTTSQRACAVLILDPPIRTIGEGSTASLRRAVLSPRFVDQFGNIQWPKQFTPTDAIGIAIPWRQKMISPTLSAIADANGDRHRVMVEAFNSSHQIFVLIYPTSELTSRIVLALP